MKTKLLVFLLLIPMLLFSQNNSDPYFLMRKGGVLEFINYNEDGEKVCSIITTITDVVGDFGNGKIEFTTKFIDNDGENMGSNDNSVLETKVETKDGKAFVEMSSIKLSLLAQDYVAKGDISSVPMDMKVGDKLPDGALNVKVKAIKTTLYVTEREVLAEETIETPAGKFNCLKVREKQESKVFGISSVFYMTTWYAKNIGSVVQEAYNKKGELVNKQILIKTY